MNIRSIYDHSPIFIQNILTSIQGLLYYRQRFGKTYKNALQEYRGRDYSNVQNLKEYQWKRVEQLLHHAISVSPFYKDFYRDVDIDTVIKKRDLTLLPILEKEIVRQNIDRLHSSTISEPIECNTSGTTGKSLCFFYEKTDFQRRLAYLDAFKINHGFIPLKMKRASFSSAKIIPKNQTSHIFWRKNIFMNQELFSGYHCKGENVPYYVQELNRYKPDSLDGYPSAIYEIAQFILKENKSLEFSPIAIFPTAETLLPHYRTTIEKAFKCPVRDQYASSEGAPFIIECKCGKLHYCMDTGIIEFSDNGEMIVTCFESSGSPLIRYKIGDKAFLSSERCKCGCAMPVVSHIEGRSADYVISREKGKFTSVYMSLVSAEFLNSIKEMQFIQNDIDSLDVYIVADAHYSQDMDDIIREKLRYSMGDKIEIRIHQVKELQKEPSGKIRFIINRISPESVK